jgi:hypothetical protein
MVCREVGAQAVDMSNPFPSLFHAQARRTLPLRPWPAAAAGAAMVALLMVFCAVLQNAVSQGELRRQAQAMQSDSMQRCRSLHGKQVLADCLAQSAPDAAGTTLAGK